MDIIKQELESSKKEMEKLPSVTKSTICKKIGEMIADEEDAVSAYGKLSVHMEESVPSQARLVRMIKDDEEKHKRYLKEIHRDYCE